MGSFKLGKMTMRSLFKKPDTVCYPFEEKPLPPGMKGHIELAINKCTMCGICAKKCPSGTIVVNRMTEEWTIDPFDCIQCGVCVRECPHGCLTMAEGYTKPSDEKFLRQYDQNEYRVLKRQEFEHKQILAQAKAEAGAASKAARAAETAEERAEAAAQAREAVKTAQAAKQTALSAKEAREAEKAKEVENDRPDFIPRNEKRR